MKEERDDPIESYLKPRLAKFGIALGRGFLPPTDPLTLMPGEFGYLDVFGKQIPDLLESGNIIQAAKSLPLPSQNALAVLSRAEKDRAMMIYGFGASAVVHSTNPPQTVIPRQIAEPLCRLSNDFGKKPILSYYSYSSSNWRRINPANDIALGNIELLQNFVKAYDEDWFILVHAAIEKKAALVVEGGILAADIAKASNTHLLWHALSDVSSAIWGMTVVLKRMPEHCSPDVYYKTVRPWIMPFSDVVFEGVRDDPIKVLRGETGAQSLIIPFLVALLGIKHGQTGLTNHLMDMRDYMPPGHRILVEEMEKISIIRNLIIKTGFRNLVEIYNECLEMLYEFRALHYEYAITYIHKKTDNPEGTGKTPFMEWLKQLMNETLEHKIT